MQIRQLWESDGKCFANKGGNCTVTSDQIDGLCGTYRCEFYKPDGCTDWLRIDTKRMVKMYPPEEVTYGE